MPSYLGEEYGIILPFSSDVDVKYCFVFGEPEDGRGESTQEHLLSMCLQWLGEMSEIEEDGSSFLRMMVPSQVDYLCDRIAEGMESYCVDSVFDL